MNVIYEIILALTFETFLPDRNSRDGRGHPMMKCLECQRCGHLI